MLRIAVCDDDARFVTQAIDMLEHWPSKPNDLCISCFTSGDTLVHAHTTSPFDIILLDMVMPLMDGIETAREIRSTDTIVKIIYMTSSPEFAVDSYSVKASNYLLKPVVSEKLYQTLDELMWEREKIERYVLVHSDSGTHRIYLDEIDCVEAQKKHSLLILAKGQTIACTEPLNFFEAELLRESEFLQCHRSFIVNINNIRFMGTNELHTHSGYRVPISRGNKDSFTKLYFDRMFEKNGG